jgi:hypothetical protein
MQMLPSQGKGMYQRTGVAVLHSPLLYADMCNITFDRLVLL